MFFFIAGIILLVIAVIAVIVAIADSELRVGAVGVAVIATLVGVGGILTQTFYSQDTGEATVIIDASGTIAGQETTPGFHGKAPWQTVQTFNIRNQQVSFIGTGKTDYSGGSAQGPDVTAQDAEGVSSDLDIAVRYSLTPTKVTDIYKQYRDESTFVSSYVTQTIRGAVRKVPNNYNTLDLLTKQGKLQADIQTALDQAFAGSGVTIDNVSLQGVNPPQVIKDKYAEAQQAQIEVSTEQAKLNAAKVSAQQQVVIAEAQAKANDTLAKSLTANVLQSRYIDTLKSIGASGNLIVVPAGSTPLVQVSKK